MAGHTHTHPHFVPKFVLKGVKAALSQEKLCATAAAKGLKAQAEKVSDT